MSIEPDRLGAPRARSGPGGTYLITPSGPVRLDEYIGQSAVKAQMSDLPCKRPAAAVRRLDHTLIFGPPGLGKTTLANIIASEMGCFDQEYLRASVGAAGRPRRSAHQPRKPATCSLWMRSISLSPVVEEILYPGHGRFSAGHRRGRRPGGAFAQAGSQAVSRLVGATTRAGLLTSPLRDRFGIVQRSGLSTPLSELAEIVTRSAAKLSVPMDIDAGGAREIAARSRGTPRIANRLLQTGAGLRGSKERRLR